MNQYNFELKEIMLLSDECLIFINQYKGMIIEQHFEELQKLYKIVRKGEIYDEIITNKYGSHFTSCPWSDEDQNVGPDTCACFYYINAREKLTNMMKLYQRISNK